MSIGSRLFKTRTESESTPDGHAWIGLDFGTATTECVIRIETPGDRNRLAVLGYQDGGGVLPVVVFPSAVEVDARAIHACYALRGSGELAELLKLDLIQSIETGFTHADILGSKAFELATIHVACILSLARQAIRNWLPDKHLRIYLNIAAPIGADLEQPKNSKTRDVFTEMGYRGLLLSQTWKDGASSVARDEAHTAFTRCMAQPLPTPELLPVFAVPESLAAVTSFLHSPNSRAGNYVTLDIGGGTTDISFFWYSTGKHSRSKRMKAWYYSIRTDRIGTTTLANLVRSQESRDPGTSHEFLWSLVSDHTSAETRRHIGTSRVNSFLKTLHQSYGESFKEAFTVRPNMRDWCREFQAQWDLLLLGGGSAIPFIRDYLTEHPPNPSNIHRHSEVAALSAPEKLDILIPDGTLIGFKSKAGSPSSKVPMRSNRHLLTVAHGLSFRAPDIPKYGIEDHVPPPKPPEAWNPPDVSPRWV